MTRPRRAFVALVAPTLLVACQLLVGIEDDRFTVVTPPTPVPDASSEAESLVDLCPRRGPVPRPEGGVGGANQTFVLAVDKYVLEDSNAGFDLDDVCTCDPRDRSKGAGRPTCVAPAGAAPACDGDGGIDNALGTALEPVASLVNVSASFNREVDCGRGTLLIVLSNYNGEADDLDVKVSLIETIGIRDPEDGGAATDAAAGCAVEGGVPTLPPRRDGTDRWDVPIGATVGARTEVAGWVNDFHLAFDGRRSPSTLPFYFGPTLVALNGAVMTGRLVPLGANGEALAIIDGRIQGGPAKAFRLVDATLAGRAPVRQVVIGAGLLEADGVLACKSVLFPGVVKPAICAAVDTVHDTSLDLLDLPCDAVSVGARFEAVPALIGSERSQEKTAPCGEDWANQTCD